VPAWVKKDCPHHAQLLDAALAAAKPDEKPAFTAEELHEIDEVEIDAERWREEQARIAAEKPAEPKPPWKEKLDDLHELVNPPEKPAEGRGT
jgi:hypothetical protein